MNKILYFLVVTLGIFILSSCSNDFDVTTDFKNVPVVYGFLSPVDTATYIRVEKAFLDPSTSAFEIAQRPDSLYYEDISVELTTGNTTFPLQRVDGNLEGYVRSTGVFANMPNYLYKLILPAGSQYMEGETYSLDLIRNGVDTAFVRIPTVMVHAPLITTPQEGDEVKWTSSVESQNSLRVRWSFNESTAAVFDIRMQVYYDEAIDGDLNNIQPRTAEFLVDGNIEVEEDNASQVENVMAVTILQAIGANVDATGPGPRFFRNFDIIIDVAGQDLLDYTSIGQANSGLTGASIPPVFSNVPGGFGLFTSRNRNRVKELVFQLEARDSLQIGRFTKQLNFQ